MTTPPSLPGVQDSETEPKLNPIPAYKGTIVLAAVLFFFDTYASGQGILSLFVISVIVPCLLLRAFLVWKNRPLRRRRLASVAIYLSVSLISVALVRADCRGAEERAEQVINACEAFKQDVGAYPQTLAELVPKYLPVLPPVRRLGKTSPSQFEYQLAGPNAFIQITNAHTLKYVSIPPFGKRYYVFEEKRWGFYD